MKFILNFILLLLCVQFSLAQNLIADSSFEKNKFIPIEYSAISASASWNSPSRGTTDLFSSCNKKDKKISRVDVPKNAFGNQEAHSGKSYAGIFVCSHGLYREYLQTSLAYSMEANKEYILSFYISLADYSRLAVDKIGVCFLSKPVKYEHSDAITDLRPVYIPLEEEVGMDITDWHQLTVIYKAKGGENTLLMGGFGIKRLWQTGNTVPYGVSSPINKNIARDAYYFIDDVSIYRYKREVIDTVEYPFPSSTVEVPDTEVVEPVTIEKLPSDVVTTFKDLFFKTGESLLSPSSHPELDIIASYMKVDPQLFIEISGHTDNAGDENKNLELSARRAEAVGAYLIAKGVNTANVSSKGFGSKKPVAENDTESGRKQNRRVEFIMKKRE